MNKEMDKRKIMMMVGIIPPHFCTDENSKQMKEYYLLKAKDSLPDLQWEIRLFEESSQITDSENKG